MSPKTNAQGGRTVAVRITDSQLRTNVLETLKGRDEYEVRNQNGRVPTDDIDICILDFETYQQEDQRDRSGNQQTTNETAILMVLSDGQFEDLGRRSAGGDEPYPEDIDDILLTPLNSQELVWRLDTLIHQQRAKSSRKSDHNQYRSMFESIKDAILVANTDREIIQCNPEFTELFGYELAEIKGMKTRHLYANPEEFNELGGKLETTDESENFFSTVQYKRKSGEEFPGETNVFPFRDGDGQIQGYIGLIRDISDRLERQRQLTLYEKAVEGSTDLLAAIDTDNQFLFANERYREFYDLISEDLEGVTVSDVLAEDVFEEIQPHLETAFEGERVEYEMKRIHPKGGTHTLDIRYFPLEEDNGGIIGVVAAMRDISDLKQREHELRLFKRAVEEAPLAIFISDDDGTIEFINSAFEEITGFPENEVLGKNPRILQSGKLDEKYYEEMWETILDGNRWHSEIPNRRNNGELYFAQQTIAPIIEEGEVSKFVAIQQDITDRKEREEHMQVLNRLLRHNLRNNLNIIEGTTDTLSRSIDDHQDMVSMLREATRDLGNISQKAYEINRLLMNPSKRTSISNLDNIIEEIVDKYDEAYPGVDVERSVTRGISTWAHPRIHRAIEELVENSFIHHDDRNPAVEVRLTESDQFVTIHVIDDGPGIPDHEYKVIEGESEITQINHGSGLGLWLSYWIVRRSGGELTFDSKDGQGTHIQVKLPKEQSDDELYELETREEMVVPRNSTPWISSEQGSNE